MGTTIQRKFEKNLKAQLGEAKSRNKGPNNQSLEHHKTMEGRSMLKRDLTQKGTEEINNPKVFILCHSNSNTLIQVCVCVCERDLMILRSYSV